jgi:hypothetical protein
VDSNLYFILVRDDPTILVVYVHALEKLITMCKQDLDLEFEMKDIDLMHYFLGLEVWRQPGEIFLG